jgi:hypothetical protein
MSDHKEQRTPITNLQAGALYALNVLPVIIIAALFLIARLRHYV